MNLKYNTGLEPNKDIITTCLYNFHEFNRLFKYFFRVPFPIQAALWGVAISAPHPSTRAHVSPLLLRINFLFLFLTLQFIFLFIFFGCVRLASGLS